MSRPAHRWSVDDITDLLAAMEQRVGKDGWPEGMRQWREVRERWVGIRGYTACTAPTVGAVYAFASSSTAKRDGRLERLRLRSQRNEEQAAKDRSTAADSDKQNRNAPSTSALIRPAYQAAAAPAPRLDAGASDDQNLAPGLDRPSTQATPSLSVRRSSAPQSQGRAANSSQHSSVGTRGTGSQMDMDGMDWEARTEALENQVASLEAELGELRSQSKWSWEDTESQRAEMRRLLSSHSRRLAALESLEREREREGAGEDPGKRSARRSLYAEGGTDEAQDEDDAPPEYTHRHAARNWEESDRYGQRERESRSPRRDFQHQRHRFYETGHAGERNWSRRRYDDEGMSKRGSRPAAYTRRPPSRSHMRPTDGEQRRRRRPTPAYTQRGERSRSPLHGHDVGDYEERRQTHYRSREPQQRARRSEAPELRGRRFRSPERRRRRSDSPTSLSRGWEESHGHEDEDEDRCRRWRHSSSERSHRR